MIKINLIFSILPLFFLYLSPDRTQNLSISDEDVTVKEALRQSDFYRGGQVEGVIWDLSVTNIEEGALKNELNLLIEAASKEENQSTLVTFLAPKKYTGQKLLLNSNNMWLYKKGLRQPMPISSRQRLTGSAANADVASTNYYNDYTINEQEEVVWKGETCWKVDLVANNNLVSYARIKYWISKEDKLGLKAEFYGKSDKLIKTAHYEYANTVSYKNKTHPYISKIEINDGINKTDKTILAVSNPRFKTFNNSKFHKNSLME